jgi:hypothetical protein
MEKGWQYICLFLIMSIFSGCGGGGGGQPVDSAPPNISDIQITPNQLGFLGGEVNVSAKADDPSGVSKVWLEVQKPNGNKAISCLYDNPLDSSPFC